MKWGRERDGLDGRIEEMGWGDRVVFFLSLVFFERRLEVMIEIDIMIIDLRDGRGMENVFIFRFTHFFLFFS